MARRQALAMAGAATMLAGSAALAVGANFGLFGLARSPSGVGNYQPASAVSPLPSTSTTTIRPDETHERPGSETTEGIRDD